MKTLLKSAALALILAISACSGDKQPLTIHDAWIAEAPPTARVMVGYMTMTNNTDQPISIIKAASENYSSIEFHQTVHEDGMARMIRHQSLEIPANGQLLLERGGRHLMMFNPVDMPKAGDSIAVMLTREDGSEIPLQLEVRKADF